MRIFTSVIVTVAIASFPLFALAGTRITIPGGTAVPVRIVDRVDSGTAAVGETFDFKADDNVVVSGFIVIARGAQGRGTVTTVDQAGGHGHPGNLGLSFSYIYAVDGEKIRLDSAKKGSSGQNNSGASSTATIASAVLLGPVGLFAHNWVKGKNVSVDSSRLFSTFVSDTVHVVATQRAAATSSDFAH